MPFMRHLLRDFDRARRQNPNWPVVVSEGDSWFSFSDVIGQLDDPGDLGQGNQRAWALLRLEKAGDEVMTILSGAQRAKLRGVFARTPIDALLFSAGGNDIIGPDLLPILRPFVDGMGAPDLISFSRFERRLRMIQDCYRDLLDLLMDAGQSTKVFVNSYDYAVPSDRPVKLFGIVKVAGPWMLPFFEERRIPVALREPVIRLLIDGFVAALDQVAAESRGAGRLIRVETRGVVQGRWKDEIHPSREGAIAVAGAFETALRNAGVIA